MTRNGTADPPNASRLQLVAAETSPRLTLSELEHPSYFVNGNFEIEWCNAAAKRVFLPGQELPPDIADRALFAHFFSTGQLHHANGREQILRLHVAVAKHRILKTSLLEANAALGSRMSQQLATLYDEADPISSRDLIRTEVDLGDSSHVECWFNLFVMFFREGILFSYTPAEETPAAVAALLARRDVVIRDILKSRRPYLTKLAVMVADLESSVKICAELPPDEYFELINTIWSTMGQLLRKYVATHGKHVGDGLVYYFLPQPDSNYIFNSIQCAQEMRVAMKDVSRAWSARKNWVNELKLNIALDEGEEWFGTYQAQSHVEFTVLGDTINRAARLSDFAKGGAVWVTKSMLSKLSPAERGRVQYGVRYAKAAGGEFLVPASYVRMDNLIDLLDPANGKLRDIAGLTVAEIFDVAAAPR
jgi:class 3 adenylate cyclase